MFTWRASSKYSESTLIAFLCSKRQQNIFEKHSAEFFVDSFCRRLTEYKMLIYWTKKMINQSKWGKELWWKPWGFSENPKQGKHHHSRWSRDWELKRNVRQNNLSELQDKKNDSNVSFHWETRNDVKRCESLDMWPFQEHANEQLLKERVGSILCREEMLKALWITQWITVRQSFTFLILSLFHTLHWIFASLTFLSLSLSLTLVTELLTS